MTSDPDLSRRVTRLENDVESIYELLGDFRTETHARFDGIDRRLDGIDRRLDRMDTRFDGIETTLAEVVRRLPDPS